MDLKAAPNTANAVTSIVFWDGPADVIGECDKQEPEDWQSNICSCCLKRPFNEVNSL